ncbi:replication initiation protein [Azohydromonas australica]|uniref:replication initiation protein n=1 Tax=Azohydromonas australica TaxID=364039 RepID=UPI000425A27C|nr:replication initiation protein [Azohydromonas australica]
MPPLPKKTSSASNEPQQLRKSERMLVMRASSVSLTLIARKMYNAMLYVAQRQGLERPRYSAPLSKLAKIIDYGGNDNATLKQIVREMQTCLIQWESPVGRDGVGWSSSQLIGGVELGVVAGQNVIWWEYSSIFKRDILEPMPYATISLVTNARLRSISALALYEICSRYKNSMLTTRHHWRWWRDALSLQPGTMKEGGEYKTFHRDVLKRAISEINSQSEIEIELVTHKEGRAISEIQFKVRANPNVQREVQALNIEPVDLALYDRAAALGIGVRWSERLIELHGDAAFSRGLDLLDARMKNTVAEPVASPHRWLEEVLDRRSLPALAVASPSDAQVQPEVPTATSPAPVPSPAMSVSDLETRERRNAEAISLYAQCSEEVKARYRHSFASTVLPGLHRSYKSDWERYGPTGRMVGPVFVRYLSERLFSNPHSPP